jgi:hypothetical protein
MTDDSEDNLHGRRVDGIPMSYLRDARRKLPLACWPLLWLIARFEAYDGVRGGLIQGESMGLVEALDV